MPTQPAAPAALLASIRRRLDASGTPAAPTGLADTLAWLLAAICAGLGLWRIGISAINADVAFFLQGGQALRDGGTLFGSWRDFNLPANYALPLLSQTIADAGTWRPADVHMLLLAGLSLGCAVLAGVLVRRAVARPWSVVAILAPSVFMIALLIRPGHNFGQRELLFLGMVLPLLITLWAHQLGRPSPRGWPGWWPGLWMGLVVAVLAGLGACLKPHFIVFLLGIAAMDLVLSGFRRRRLFWPAWLALLVALAELLRVWLMHPAYFTEMLPLALLVYAPASEPLELAWSFLATPGGYRTGLTTALLLLLHALLRPGAGQFRFVACWAGCLTMAIGMYIGQGLGLHYHRIFFEGLVQISATLTLAFAAELVLRLVLPRLAWPRPATALMLALPLLVVSWRWPGLILQRSWVVGSPLVAALDALPPGSDVAAIQSLTWPVSVIPAYARVRLRFAGFAGLLVELPEIAAQQARTDGLPPSPAIMALRAAMLARLSAGLETTRPGLVLVEGMVNMGRTRLPMLPYGRQTPDLPAILALLAEDARFASAWSHYARAASVELPAAAALDTHIEMWRRLPAP